MRHQPVPDGLFKPKASATETKQDATSKVARQIIDHEVAAREKKTERLRLARLAMEAAEAAKPVAPSPAKKPAGKRKKA